jgi:hypothetical protein
MYSLFVTEKIENTINFSRFDSISQARARSLSASKKRSEFLGLLL